MVQAAKGSPAPNAPAQIAKTQICLTEKTSPEKGIEVATRAGKNIGNFKVLLDLQFVESCGSSKIYLHPSGLPGFTDWEGEEIYIDRKNRRLSLVWTEPRTPEPNEILRFSPGAWEIATFGTHSDDATSKVVAKDRLALIEFNSAGIFCVYYEKYVDLPVSQVPMGHEAAATISTQIERQLRQ